MHKSAQRCASVFIVQRAKQLNWNSDKLTSAVMGLCFHCHIGPEQKRFANKNPESIFICRSPPWHLTKNLLTITEASSPTRASQTCIWFRFHPQQRSWVSEHWWERGLFSEFASSFLRFWLSCWTVCFFFFVAVFFFFFLAHPAWQTEQLLCPHYLCACASELQQFVFEMVFQRRFLSEIALRRPYATGKSLRFARAV